MKPKFFPRPEDLRKWFEKNHQSKKELQVGYYKIGSGKASITWPQSVDQALCFGWIDGIRHSLNDESYTIRFTPRKERSHWSNVNIKRFAELKKQGLIQKAGLEAYAKMDIKNSRRASFEQKEIKLPRGFESKIKVNKKAWAFFQKMVPSTKKPTIWWVISAKKEETKIKRLEILIKSAEAGLKIPLLRFGKKKN